MKKAANQGDKDAQNNLGRYYYNGLGVPKDLEKAFYWFEKAANQNKEAQYNMGVFYYQGQVVQKDLKQAEYWWEKAAEQGDPNAQASLGLLYRNDDKDVSSVIPQNPEKSIYWTQKAANQGVVRSQYDMGLIYYAGLGGMKKDRDKAMEWWEKAAQAGNMDAQQALGICYMEKKRYQVIWKNLFIGFKRRLPKVPHLPSVTWEPFMPWGWEA